jgi:diguanylate cyclase (GGDEF)-like protein
MALARATPSAALRLARRGWRLQFVDAGQALALAERALALAGDGDLQAAGWARLVRAFHRMRYSSRASALDEFDAAKRLCDAAGDRGGQILADVGIARCELHADQPHAALARLLPLRTEGLRVLRHLSRAILLNGIAGCYSGLDQSAEAFAYMYQALREARHARRLGFDVVLLANLGYELCQLGDCEEGLRYLNEGLEACAELRNLRLRTQLLVNRIVCLTDLGRAAEALADIELLESLPAREDVRGTTASGYESMAIAAYRAGAAATGDRLVARAQQALADDPTQDVRAELAVALAERAGARGDLAGARDALAAALPLPPAGSGLSLRVRCLFLQLQADVLQRAGDAAGALAALREWQSLHTARATLALRARHQSMSLQAELLRLQRERDGIEARHRAAERARAELAAINRQLSQRVEEVQRLQAELEAQAVRDFLTGLFNRRHLSDVLPPLLALAQRNGEPLAVAIIDLDHFKQVNDRHGHATGDRLLQAFGELMRQGLRRSDVACRYGGEEFCVLMPRTDAHGARRKIDALRRQWRDVRVEVEGGVIAGCTFSAGVADSLTAAGGPDRLLKAADDCALDAKRRGRNQSVVFSAARQDRVAGDRAPTPPLEPTR